MGYDRDAPKRAVSVDLNEDLLRQATLLTGDLPGTLETLLAEFVARGRDRKAEDRALLTRQLDAWNAFHAEHGLLSDEFPTL